MQIQLMKCSVPNNVLYWLCGHLRYFSVYMPYGRQDMNGWPTRFPLCLSRKTTAQRIREREDRPSHPDAANLLPASHMNRYTIVWSTACFAWTETQPRRYTSWNWGYTKSKSAMMQDYKVYVMLKALSSDCQSRFSQ